MKIEFLKNPYLTLTYDSKTLTDGVGAQLERIWSIYWCAKNFRVNYLHSPIVDMLNHPLDFWQSPEEKKNFIAQLNSEFNLPSDINKEFKEVKTYEVLTRPLFFLNYARSIIQKKPMLLQVCRLFDGAPKNLPYAPYTKTQVDLEKQKLIVAHVRNALPLLGLPQRRNLDITYYQELIEHFTDKLDSDRTSYQVIILTDHPQFDITIPISFIEKDHVWMWFFTEDQIERDRFEIKGVDLKSIYFSSNANVKVLHGGDTLEALRIMAIADFLILSRSSLSSVGGKLNLNGTVIQPPDFLYKALKKWIPASRFIKIQNRWRESRYPRITSFLPPTILRLGRFCLRTTRKIISSFNLINPRR